MVCYKCGADKPVSEFRSQQKRTRSLCLVCSRKYGKEYYQTHRAEAIARALRSKKRYILLMRKLKEKPCADCQHKFPYYVMDFDHISNDKVSEIASLVARGYWKRAIAEMKKCEVVCSNCHRVRTHERKQGRLAEYGLMRLS